MPRRDLEQFEAAKARFAAAEAEREEVRLAETPPWRWRTLPLPPRGRLTFLAGPRAPPSAGPGRPGPHKARPDAAPDPEQHSRPTEKRMLAVSAVSYVPRSGAADHRSLAPRSRRPTAAPRTKEGHFLAGYRPPALAMSPGYPEPSPYAAAFLPGWLAPIAPDEWSIGPAGCPRAPPTQIGFRPPNGRCGHEI